MNKPVQSVLDSSRKASMIFPLGCSVFGHGFVVVVALVVTMVSARCTSKKPIIDLNRTMAVSMVQKSETNIPDRAQRAPVPKGDVEPSPQPKPTQNPNPSDLVFEKEDAEMDEGLESDRQAALDELKRQELLAEMLDAPEGATDRNVTDPNSDSEETINALRAGAVGDPEYARYTSKIRDLVKQQFNPLQAITAANPDIRCILMVQADMGSGRITSVDVTQSSGVPAYDESAKQALYAVGTFPLPPERFKALFATGYPLEMTP